MTLNEITLRDLNTNGVSNITYKAYNDRMKSDNNLALLDSVTFANNGEDVRCTFSVEGSSPSIQNDYTDYKPGFYTVMIQFIGGVKYFSNALNRESISNAWDQMVQNCDIKVFSDDPSFYYQGFWEDLDNLNMTIFPYNGPNSDGIWTERHGTSGGNLVIPEIRVTKHLKQIMDHIWDYKEQVISLVSSGSVLREKLTSTEINLLNNNEHFIRTKIIPKIAASSDSDTILSNFIQSICNNEEDESAIYSALFNIDDIDSIMERVLDNQTNIVKLTEEHKDGVIKMSKLAKGDTELRDLYLNLYKENEDGRYFFAFLFEDSVLLDNYSNTGSDKYFINSSNKRVELKNVNSTFESSEYKNFITVEDFIGAVERAKKETKCDKDLFDYDYDKKFTTTTMAKGNNRGEVLSSIGRFSVNYKKNSAVRVKSDLLVFDDVNLTILFDGIQSAVSNMLYHNKDKVKQYFQSFLKHFFNKNEISKWDKINKMAKMDLEKDFAKFVDIICEDPKQIPNKFLEMQLKYLFYEKSVTEHVTDNLLILSQLEKGNDISFMIFDLSKKDSQISSAFGNKTLNVRQIKNKQATLGF